MKYFSLIFLLLFLISCQTQENDGKVSNTIVQDSKEESEKDLSLSIFQLPTTWETQNDEEIQFSDLKGDVLVVVMIYTTCKAACPRLVADMKNIQDDVGLDINNPVRYVLVSIDPETDTPERMKEFSIENEMTDDHWLFLRSSDENTREFANVLAVQYAEISPIDFSHSNIISVFDQDGILVHQQEGLGVDNEETVAEIKRLAD